MCSGVGKKRIHQAMKHSKATKSNKTNFETIIFAYQLSLKLDDNLVLIS